MSQSPNYLKPFVFLEHDNEFTALKWLPRTPDLNPKEYLWVLMEQRIGIMDAQLTNLEQLRDAVMSIWTKIYEECFQDLFGIYATKNEGRSGGKRRSNPGVPNKVAGERGFAPECLTCSSFQWNSAGLKVSTWVKSLLSRNTRRQLWTYSE